LGAALSSGKENHRMKRSLAAVMTAVFLAVLVPGAALAAPPLPGAVFTTDSTCTGVNLNIYGSKDAVYLDGGPAHPGAAGLADGSYYVQVTEPDGTVLGKSTTAVVQVSGGEFAECYQLSAILLSTSSSFTAAGYDTTSNPGGEYKVWVSSVAEFDNDSTKTDNFKVKDTGGEQPEAATLQVIKFYDANANGLNDDSATIVGWKVRIQDGMDIIRYTPVSVVVEPDDYTITEFTPVETNWIHTTATVVGVTLADGDDETVEFGNVCLGAGGGHTLGFWSNKNGQAVMNDGGSSASELALLAGLNLRNANGSNFDPTTYAAFRTWLLNATATNMAYMLSAQLAAMELNVESGMVDGSALVYAPGSSSANSLGFASINALMGEANTELGLHGNVLADSPDRAYQEALKNALDAANNNLNFVQSAPCAFSFAG
jgi:hypothetical protein